MTTPTFDRATFLRSIRLLHTLTAPAAVKAGIIRFGDHVTWQAFRSNPVKWLCTADPRRIDAACRYLGERFANLPAGAIPTTTDTNEKALTQ